VNTIYANIIFTVHAAHQYFEKNNIQVNDDLKKILENCSNLAKGENLLLKGSAIFTEDLHAQISKLWAEDIFKECLAACRTEFHIFDGAEYFFSDLARLKPPKYVPNTQDALRCRRKTTGMIEFTCTPKIEGKGETVFKIVDVGGQRNERKKWPSFYEGITALIFVCSLNEFDQLCYEDDTTNRMIESIDLFDENTNGAFRDRPVILFLNKIDLFSEKVKKSELKKTFPEFEGQHDSEKAIEFIKNKFLKTNNYAPDRIHCFITCATDKDMVKKSLDDILKLIAEGKLEVTKK